MWLHFSVFTANRPTMSLHDLELELLIKQVPSMRNFEDWHWVEHSQKALRSRGHSCELWHISWAARPRDLSLWPFDVEMVLCVMRPTRTSMGYIYLSWPSATFCS